VSRRLALMLCAALVAPLPLVAVSGGTALATAGYTVQPLRIKITPAADSDCAGTTPSVAADLYTPTGQGPGPFPAILTTNGFGGDKSDQTGVAKAFALHGYVVLSYSGLGFGGSSCRISLDDREHDGLVGSQLIDVLGGKPGVATVDPRGTNTSDPAYHGPADLTGAAVTVTDVKHDDTDHAGVAQTYDPRVGMIGGSYGGQIQFAIAGRDARLDTIVPIITWNDLSYSLAPNNTSLAPGTVTYSTPGTAKMDWTGLFFVAGQAQDASYVTEDPADRLPTAVCPNFDPAACTALLQETTSNYPDDTTLAFIRHASVHSYVANIKIPTFLAQGQADTLFNLQESVATYRQLKAQGTPVKLLWQSWGHSNSKPVAGELDLNAPTGTYEGGLFQQWFDHYLKDNPSAPALDFSYFRDYAYTAPNAAAAYAQAPAYPVGTTQQLYLSSTKDLTPARGQVVAGASQFGTPGGGVPLS